MPGLAGCVSGGPIDTELINAMAEPMRYRPNYRVRIHAGDAFGVASIDHSSELQSGVAVSRDGRYRLTYFGMFYEPWTKFDRKNAERLLARWLEQGWKGLADLNGEYLALIWDRIDEKLTIVNDRLGLKRFCYWHNHEMFAFASEVKSLAVLSEVSRKINEFALAELLTFGHFQEDRTILADVKALLPGTVLTWEKGEIKLHRYWTLSYQADCSLEDPQNAIEEYGYRLRTAVSRRIGNSDRLGLFLGGGLDSRAIGGNLRRLRPKATISTWTSGHGHDHDSRFSRGIAKVLRSRHTEIRIPETFLRDFGLDYAWILDGMVSADGCHRSTLVAPARGMADIYFNGFLGDVLAGSNLLEKVLHLSSLNEVIDHGYRYYAGPSGEEFLESIFKPDLFRHLQGGVRETFSDFVRSADAENLPDCLGWATVYLHLFGDSKAQVELLGLDYNIASPFADRDFIDFIRRLPLKHRIARKTYIAMICQDFPGLARVPRSGDGLPLVHSRLREALHWRWVLFERHQLPRLTAGLLGGHPYSHFVHCHDWFIQSNRSFIREQLMECDYLGDCFDLGAINKLVDGFLERKLTGDFSKSIAALISIVVFRKKLNEIKTVDRSRKTGEVMSV